MSVRRTVLIPFLALFAALTLVAGACSSDDSSDEGSKKTTTTEKAKDDGSDSTDTTEAAKSDEEFSAAIDDARRLMPRSRSATRWEALRGPSESSPVQKTPSSTLMRRTGSGASRTSASTMGRSSIGVGAFPL